MFESVRQATYELHIGTPVNLEVETTKGPETYSAGSTLAEYGLSINSTNGFNLWHSLAKWESSTAP